MPELYRTRVEIAKIDWVKRKCVTGFCTCPIFFLFIPRHYDSGGVYDITLAVRVSVRPSVFSFLDGNLSKCRWIATKLGVCIDIVEIWFRIVNGQISSIFDRPIFSFPDDNFSKYQLIFTRLGVRIDIVEI